MSQPADGVTVRGYVEPRADGLWYAHCIDLTVDALAPTREEALAKLNRAAVAYLEWAAHRGAPLHRPSPLSFQLRYYFLALQDKVRFLVRRSPDHQDPQHTFHHRPLAA